MAEAEEEDESIWIFEWSASALSADSRGRGIGKSFCGASEEVGESGSSNACSSSSDSSVATRGILSS
jgi:hypothetical protein